MMKLSRSVQYAVQATIHLAQAAEQSRLPCRVLAQNGDMPERFLLHVLRSLVERGILRSTRGVDGGYSLNRSPEEITLMDIIEAVDGPSEVQQIAILQAPMQRVNDVIRQELVTTKLSQLVELAQTPPGEDEPVVEPTAGAVEELKNGC